MAKRVTSDRLMASAVEKLRGLAVARKSETACRRLDSRFVDPFDCAQGQPLWDKATVEWLSRKTNYPEAEDFAAHNVLLPPSEETMLGVFSGT
jgi:hypothetical protein